jgi:hypothetical protein
MKDTEKFRILLRRIIDIHGLEKAREIVDEILTEPSIMGQKLSVNCCFCKQTLSDASRKGESIFFAKCKNCIKEFIVYCGRARTIRHKNDIARRCVTIRCYDLNGDERIIEFYQKNTLRQLS